MIIQNDDDRCVLLFAFRYALGRRTYAPDLIVEQLKLNWHKLFQRQRLQVCWEIEEAIASKHAGDTCDVATWKKILALTGGKE